MAWLQSLDVALLRFINLDLRNPAFDWLMPVLSWNSLFLPFLILGAAALLWKGGLRGRLFLALVVMTVAIGDGLICNALKEAVDRPRPFQTIPDLHLMAGKGRSGSMPSSHAANWFSAATIAFLFWRRSLWLILPVALLVSFSRLYVGVHYPSDVLAGAMIGVAYALGIAWGLNQVWKIAGPRWFPAWWRRCPSLLGEPAPESPAAPAAEHEIRAQRIRLGYLLIAALLLARLWFIGSGRIELSEDEAYQWLWSKHPDLSYFSKPPMIAYAQLLGTTLWGDTEFGIRFLSPVLGALMSVLLLRFLAREVNARVGLALVGIVATTPLLAVGSLLMTIDPLSVFFWTLAMITGWKAVNTDRTAPWVWTGVWMGLGFLSKYVALFQLLCWAVYFVLHRPARVHLRRAGPYLALGIFAVSTVPVLAWNSAHNWITVTHLADRGGLDQSWIPTARYLVEFVGAEFGLLNPVFFVAAVWAAVAFWRRFRSQPLALFLFCMGAPVFLIYLGYTLRSRVHPNWIAPAVLPLFCLMVVYWEARWRDGARSVRSWLVGGIVFGVVGIVLMHDTDLIGKIAGTPLAAKADPLRRVKGWRASAAVVETARIRLSGEGKPAFVIGDHYGITGLLSFYIPAAKAGVPNNPLVYYQTTEHPKNQFYFWPGYRDRKGENAIYVREVKAPRGVPPELEREFESIVDLGIHDVTVRGRVLHRLQLFECRGLK